MVRKLIVVSSLAAKPLAQISIPGRISRLMLLWPSLKLREKQLKTFKTKKMKRTITLLSYQLLIR